MSSNAGPSRRKRWAPDLEAPESKNMKRKNNGKKALTVTDGPVELHADDLAAVSGGSGSHHTQWYEWSTWNFKGGPVQPGIPTGPQLP